MQRPYGYLATGLADKSLGLQAISETGQNWPDHKAGCQILLAYSKPLQMLEEGTGRNAYMRFDDAVEDLPLEEFKPWTIGVGGLSADTVRDVSVQRVHILHQCGPSGRK